jgi:hypothetical protein
LARSLGIKEESRVDNFQRGFGPLFDQLAHWENGAPWCEKIHTDTYRLVGTRGGIAFQIDVGRERRNSYVHVINENDIFFCQILPQLLPDHKLRL